MGVSTAWRVSSIAGALSMGMDELLASQETQRQIPRCVVLISIKHITHFSCLEEEREMLLLQSKDLNMQVLEKQAVRNLLRRMMARTLPPHLGRSARMCSTLC